MLGSPNWLFARCVRQGLPRDAFRRSRATVGAANQPQGSFYLLCLELGRLATWPPRGCVSFPAFIYNLQISLSLYFGDGGGCGAQDVGRRPGADGLFLAARRPLGRRGRVVRGEAVAGAGAARGRAAGARRRAAEDGDDVAAELLPLQRVPDVPPGVLGRAPLRPVRERLREPGGEARHPAAVCDRRPDEVVPEGVRRLRRLHAARQRDDVGLRRAPGRAPEVAPRGVADRVLCAQHAARRPMARECRGARDSTATRTGACSTAWCATAPSTRKTARASRPGRARTSRGRKTSSRGAAAASSSTSRRPSPTSARLSRRRSTTRTRAAGARRTRDPRLPSRRDVVGASPTGPLAARGGGASPQKPEVGGPRSATSTRAAPSPRARASTPTGPGRSSSSTTTAARPSRL